MQESSTVSTDTILDLIRSRWSPKVYSNRPVEREHLRRENSHAWHDAGLATQNLVIQATAAGLFVHSMAGFSASRAVELFEIPDGHEPIAMHTLGYLGDPSDTPEEIVDGDPAKRKRHPLEDFVFTGQWGTPSDLI